MDPSARPHRRRTRVATALVATLALAAALAALPASSRAYGQPADSTNSQAPSAAQDQTGAQTVKVGWLLDNQGFQSGTPGEYQSGWGYEYLQTLSYYAPAWRYEYVTGTFSELMDKLEAGEIDLMPNISYTEERAQKLLFSSNPEGTEHYYIYAKPGRADLATGDPNALNGLTIGCNQGVMQTEVGQQWIADKGVTCDYRYYATGNELFSALADDEVDAIIMNDTLSSGDAMPMFSVGESNYYFVVPKSRQGLMDQINEAMTSLRSTNPRYNDEVKTHYSTDGSGSSSLTAKEGAWLDARGGQITLGYLSGARVALRGDGEHAGLFLERRHGEGAPVRRDRRRHARGQGLLACRAGQQRSVLHAVLHLAHRRLRGRRPPGRPRVDRDLPLVAL